MLEDPSSEPSSRGRLSAWLQERLFGRRIVLVTGWLDDTIAAQTAAELMTLDATGDEPVELHLDSPDGILEAAFVLIDTLDLLHATVRVHCRGRVGGPAIGVLAAADHRSALPHTRFQLAQPTAHLTGTPSQIASRSQQQQDLLWRLQARLAQVTGRPSEEIADDMRRGRYLDAREALEYGLIDAISTTAP
ncbi:MAG: ATP-dependent Clp protease proteolytic subunit [Candidatus Rokuibacteriota bacterium]